MLPVGATCNCSYCSQHLVADCASKFGAVGFAEAMRLELRKKGKTGVKTTLVCPFYIKTGMFEGVQSRFPLLPLLEPGTSPVLSRWVATSYHNGVAADYVTQKVVQAIRRNTAMLCLPRIVYATPLLRALLPTSLLDWTSEVLGISDSMNQFKGRSKL